MRSRYMCRRPQMAAQAPTHERLPVVKGGLLQRLQAQKNLQPAWSEAFAITSRRHTDPEAFARYKWKIANNGKIGAESLAALWQEYGEWFRKFQAEEAQS